MSRGRDKYELGACSACTAAVRGGMLCLPLLHNSPFASCAPTAPLPATALPARSSDVRRELSYNLRRCLNFFAVVLLANHFFACLIYLVLRVQDFPAGACRRRAVSLAQKTYVM